MSSYNTARIFLQPIIPGAPAQKKEAECGPKSPGCNAVDSVTQGEGNSVLSDVGGSWAQWGGGGESSANGARTSSRRYELEDKMDPDGWVVIISEGPAPRLIASAAPQDGWAGVRAARSGGAMAGQINAVNWKRFHKKVNRADKVLNDCCKCLFSAFDSHALLLAASD